MSAAGAAAADGINANADRVRPTTSYAASDEQTRERTHIADRRFDQAFGLLKGTEWIGDEQEIL